MDFEQYYHFLYAYNRLPALMRNTRICLPEFSDTSGIYKLWNDGYWVQLIRNREIEAEQNQSIYKLYLGLDPKVLSSSFDLVIDQLLHLDPIGVKWGAKEKYLLRSDRFMVYYHSMDQIVKASEMVMQAINGLHFQDVPFTIRINPTSAISYGIDPSGASQKQISWRSEVCKKIAEFALKKDVICNRDDFIQQAFRKLEKFAEDAQS
jgi:hypothetical protein